jgi:hypothetical protein
LLISDRRRNLQYVEVRSAMKKKASFSAEIGDGG